MDMLLMMARIAVAVSVAVLMPLAALLMTLLSFFRVRTIERQLLTTTDVVRFAQLDARQAVWGSIGASTFVFAVALASIAAPVLSHMGGAW